MPSKYYRKHDGYYDRKPILQFRMNGDFVKRWPNAHKIQRDTGMDRNSILRACKGVQKRAYWFIWRFEIELFPEK